QHGADGAVDVADRVLDHHWLAAFQRRLRQFDELHIQRALEVMFLFFAMADRNTRLALGLIEDARQVDALRLPVLDGTAHVELVDLTDHVLEFAEAELRHQLAHFLGDEEEEIDDVLRLAGELGAQYRVLGSAADRAGVEMPLAHHDAAGGDQRRGREAELVGADQRADDNVAAGAQAAIDLDRDAAAQPV